MSTTEILQQLRRLNNSERLQIIEAITQLIRDDLQSESPNPRAEQDRRLAAAAMAVKDLYEPGGELTEWISLDSEDILDGSVLGWFRPGVKSGWSTLIPRLAIGNALRETPFRV
jgi:hypothetical protein